MEISLQNIGIVKNSQLTLNGLTVITGKNNSGKSTVGKALYSILDSVCNIQQKAESDKRVYICSQLDMIQSVLETFRFYRLPLRSQETYPIISQFISKTYWSKKTLSSVELFAHDFQRELSKFDTSLFEDNPSFVSYRKNYRHPLSSSEEGPLSSIFDSERERAFTILSKMFDAIEKDPELISYARESIDQTLNVEFSNQIQPVRTPHEKSHIKLSDDQSIYFDFDIQDNHVSGDESPAFLSSPYKKVYFIDSPFILDDEPFLQHGLFGSDAYENGTFFNHSRLKKHSEKLKSILRSGKNTSVFEQTVINDSLRNIKNAIDSALPGSFDFSSDGEYYIQNDVKLSFSNLATGSKLFSILKILLEKGELDDTTMLILDEPEAHLHPQWQNLFAEIIMMLVKQLGVSVLLTTHSPNFMLAIDAYMRKYQLSEKSSFYQTSLLPDGFVQYQCVNNDMDVIYRDFLQYLSEMKLLRNKYLYDDED